MPQYEDARNEGGKRIKFTVLDPNKCWELLVRGVLEKTFNIPEVNGFEIRRNDKTVFVAFWINGKKQDEALTAIRKFIGL